MKVRSILYPPAILVALFTLSLAACGGGGSASTPIQKTTPVITWPTPVAITYGTPLSSTQLDATASVAGSFVYNPLAGTVPTAGTQTLSVTFTPTDTTNYNNATGSVQLVVNKATPTITTWPTASAITYGAALSTSTLTGGTASTPGAFAWTASSTVPAVGTDSESVTFTPTDAVDYMSVIGNVQVVVNPATPQIANYTLGGGPYAVEDEFSNAFLQTVLTCAGCEIGDTISVTVATNPAGNGTLVSTLPGTATTYYSFIIFNSDDSEPSWPSAEIQHPGGAYGNQYAVPFLSVGNQSTLAVSPTGTVSHIEQTTGQVYTRTAGGTTGTFFPTCTSLICEQSAVQIAIDDVSGNVAYLHTGKNDKGSVPYVTVYTPTGGTVCSVTATGMSYVSGIAAKGGYMVFTDPTENLVGKAKMDCSGYTTVSVAGQPWAVSMAMNGAELDAYVVSRDKASANGLPMLSKLNVLTGVVEGTVELTGFTLINTIRATTLYEGIYQVQAFSLTSTATVLFMSDSTDGTVLIINTNTSGGAKMAITHTVSVPELPIAIAMQESVSSSTVWVNYLLGNGEAITHIGAINPTTGNYTPGIGACATGLIGGFAADANGVHCAGGSTIAAPLVLQP
jgi:hypothetical protein